MYLCMYVCMYECMNVWMYECMNVCSQDRHANTMSLGEWQWPVLAACVMRSAAVLANVEGWRTSCAEVPGRSGKSDSNNTPEQPNCAVNHESLVSWRSKSFRRGNQNQWQLQQTHQNMFNRRAAREHIPYLCTSPEEHMQCHVMWLEAFSPQLCVGFLFLILYPGLLLLLLLLLPPPSLSHTHKLNIQ